GAVGGGGGRAGGRVGGEGRRHVGVAAARRQRFWLRSDVPARGRAPDVRGNVERGQARPSAARPRALASRPRVRQTGGGLPCRSLSQRRSASVRPTAIP